MAACQLVVMTCLVWSLFSSQLFVYSYKASSVGKVANYTKTINGVVRVSSGTVARCPKHFSQLTRADGLSELLLNSAMWSGKSWKWAVSKGRLRLFVRSLAYEPLVRVPGVLPLHDCAVTMKSALPAVLRM